MTASVQTTFNAGMLPQQYLPGPLGNGAAGQLAEGSPAQEIYTPNATRTETSGGGLLSRGLTNFSMPTLSKAAPALGVAAGAFSLPALAAETASNAYVIEIPKDLGLSGALSAHSTAGVVGLGAFLWFNQGPVAAMFMNPSFGLPYFGIQTTIGGFAAYAAGAGLGMALSGNVAPGLLLAVAGTAVSAGCTALNYSLIRGLP